MNKALLLTKSNLRKNRGTSIGLFLLMLIATSLIGVSLLIFFDCYPTVRKAAERLNSGDGFLQIYGSVDGFTDEKIDEIIRSQSSDEVFRQKCAIVIDNSGELAQTVRQLESILTVER